MYTDAIYALLHYLAIFGLIIAMSAELVLCRGALDATAVRRLARIDIALFVSALLVVGSGLLRAFFGIKGWWFYSDNLFFWIKIGTFVVIALLSIVPTVAFIRWRKHGGGASAHDTARVRRFVVWQTMLLPILPACAVLMARGIE